MVDKLINSILPDLAIPATRGPHSQPLFKHIAHPDLQWYGYDPAKAKQLLEKAGWRDRESFYTSGGERWRFAAISKNLRSIAA